MMRTVSIAGFAAALMLVRGAVAAPSLKPFVVSIEPSSTCPEVELFATRLLERSRRLTPALGAEPAIRFTVTAGATPSGYGGRLRIAEPDSPPTERVVSGDTCAGVVDALALVAAILAEGREPPLPPQPTPQPPLATPPSAPPDPEPLRRRSAQRPWTVGFGITLGINSATGPTMPLGPGADFVVGYRSETLWAPELRVGAVTRLPSQASTEAGDATFRWWAVRVLASPLRWPSRGALSLRPIAGVELGRLTATGDQTVDPAGASPPWWALALGALGEGHWFEPLAVTGELGAVVPGRRDDFYFDTPSGRLSAFRAKKLGVSARIGLTVRIP